MYLNHQRHILSASGGNVRLACWWQMGGLPLCHMSTSCASVWLSEALCVIPSLSFLSLSDLLPPLYPPAVVFFFLSSSYFQAQICVCTGQASQYGKQNLTNSLSEVSEEGLAPVWQSYRLFCRQFCNALHFH